MIRDTNKWGTPIRSNEVETAIRTRHLTKVFRRKLVAVNDLNLQVPKGAVFGLLGPNGAGKTTTLRLLLGLHRPSAGHAEVFGRRCGVNAVSVRRSIGYLPTNPKLPGHLRPVEYLDLLGRLNAIPREQRMPRIASLLRAVGLLGATAQRIATFSTGMVTRLGIAASLVADPPLLVWDEPTAGLDPAARRFTLDLIAQLAQTRTILVATHILSDIDQVCSHVGVMHEGRAIFCGSIKEMKRRIRRNSYRLCLDGNGDAIAALARRIDAMDGARARVEAGDTLTVTFSEDRLGAGDLAEVLQMVESAQLRLHAIQSGWNETEQIYLQLLQEDQSHGFQRFDVNMAQPDDALHRDPTL